MIIKVPPRLFAAAYHMLGRVSGAKDILQTIFLEVSKGWIRWAYVAGNSDKTRHQVAALNWPTCQPRDEYKRAALRRRPPQLRVN